MRPPIRLTGIVRHIFSRLSARLALADVVQGDTVTTAPNRLQAATRSGECSAAPLQLIGLGIGPEHWAFHAWLQWLPLSLGSLSQLQEALTSDRVSPVASSTIALQLGYLERLDDKEWDILRNTHAVYDPSPNRIQTLKEHGIEARLLSPTGNANGWLHGSDRQLQEASEKLGLPPPHSLLGIAKPQDGMWLTLGSAGEHWEAALPCDWMALPAFDELLTPDWQSARLLASWLNACCRLGIQLVRIHPSLQEFASTPFRALQPPISSDTPDWITPPMVWGPIQPHDLAAELRWLRAGRPIPELEPTPEPDVQVLWESVAENPVSATICVSLYNYSDRIIAALDSCAAQTEDNLELLIVDDASDDDSVMVVMKWLENHASRFVVARFLGHRSNCGLAAARNTAFNAARAKWCFVLDADNILEPDALKNCLAIATQCSDLIGVVHPLVALRQEQRHPRQPEGSLLTRISWQKQRFLHGNLIDAMALVRKSAWQQVGGYTHIPGGWEDFDFWCKLIQAGFGGVLCPQKLAIYNRHQASMQATQTIRGERPLKRLLMSRHPWLKLEDEIVI